MPHAAIVQRMSAQVTLKPGCRVAVLGAGRSGLASTRLLRALGVEVFVSDQNPLDPQVRCELTALGVPCEEGGHTERALEHTQLLVLSPGIPLSAPIVQAACARKIPVWGELELAYRFCPTEKIIAVTGTNGKTTTVHFIERLLRGGVVSAGNIGTPLSARLKEITKETILVLEVSSFQLETIQKFRPHVAVFLNFAPNHLDRHPSIASYFAAKCRIFANQIEQDFLVLPRALRLPARPRSRLIFYDDLLPELKSFALAQHLKENLAAAMAACRIFAPTIQSLTAEELQQLRLPHRQEFIAEIGGVKFYDDSKATTIHATLAALQAFSDPLVLILGGRNKNLDFGPLVQALRAREIREALLIGEAAPQIARALKEAEVKRYAFVKDFAEAVERALHHPGSVCLLSPACASFDQFKSYEERGEAFRQAVAKLIPNPRAV